MSLCPWDCYHQKAKYRALFAQRLQLELKSQAGQDFVYLVTLFVVGILVAKLINIFEWSDVFLKPPGCTQITTKPQIQPASEITSPSCYCAPSKAFDFLLHISA